MPINWNDVLHRAELADIAYPAAGSRAPWKEIANTVRKLGYDTFDGFDIAGTQAFVCANDVEVCYVFRGSDELVDWVKNLKFTRRVALKDATGSRFGRVHRGFLEAAEPVAGDVAQRVRELIAEHPTRTVHGVGHSLGAACAALVAITHLRARRPRLTLFGCPRIGNKRFAREFNFVLGDRTIAVRNNNDIVTLSPFWNRTIGRQWYLTDDARAVDHPGWWFRAWQQVKAKARWIGKAALHRFSFGTLGAPPELLEQVSDHFMLNYRAAVERLVKRN